MHKLGRAVSLKRLRGYSIAIIVVLLLGVSVLVIHLGVLDQLASSISSFGGATTTVFFMPYGEESLSPGGITSIDVNINTKVPINALGATISFPKESFDIVGISKEKSFFNLWTEDTTIAEGLGEIRFSGGTTKRGGVMGTGTVFTITVRAKGSGSAELQFKNTRIYFAWPP